MTDAGNAVGHLPGEDRDVLLEAGERVVAVVGTGAGVQLGGLAVLRIARVAARRRVGRHRPDGHGKKTDDCGRGGGEAQAGERVLDHGDPSHRPRKTPWLWQGDALRVPSLRDL